MASALDRLLAQALESMIREKLGQKTCEKIEDRLHQRYNLSLAESIKDFYTLDATLREFFASGADAIEEDFANRLISINALAKGRPWITIDNWELAELIAEAYGDKEKRLILEVALRQPLVIPNMLEILGIPKSSGYRLINKLVEDGLLTEQGYAEASDGKKVSKYTALFERVKMELDTKGLIVQVLLKENILKESQIIHVLLRGKLGMA
jgi:transposase